MQVEINKTEWIAAHIFHSWPFEPLLINGIKPLINKLLAEGVASRFFYIRYMENGPHIRLRFCAQKKNIPMVTSTIKSHIDQYLQEHPSKMVYKAQDEFINSGKWFPNNSIQYIPYEPEVNRYGGPKAMPFAEALFQASSEAILSCLHNTADWNYQSAMGCAIRMHLAFAHAAGMNLAEVHKFFRFVYLIWLDFSIQLTLGPSKSQDELKEKHDDLVKLFQESFSKQSSTLIPYHENFWETLESGVAFEEDWLNNWYENVQTVLKAYQNLRKENQLLRPTYVSEDINFDMMYCFYDSFVHMTNNRLGILNNDEAFLGYIIHQSIAEISN